MTSRFSFFPHEASTIAGQVDAITLALLLVCGFTMMMVAGLIFVFGIIYRKGSSRSREIKKKGQTGLEFLWTFVAFIIFLGLFSWAAFVFFQMHLPPEGCSEISVVGKQWMWKFQHPNGKRELGELHIPVGIPILLTLTSEDVIHSFFVPEFRVKQDVLPGRYTRLWFEASKVGEYHLFCTQYCGTMHAGMLGKILVLSKKDYELWLQTGIPDQVSHAVTPPLSMASRGSRLYTRLGCASCHDLNPGVKAPTLTGLFGASVPLRDGTTAVADETYIRESIMNPNAKIVQGYSAMMPSYAGLVSEEDVLDLIAYIKSLEGTPASKLRRNE